MSGEGKECGEVAPNVKGRAALFHEMRASVGNGLVCCIYFLSQAGGQSSSSKSFVCLCWQKKLPIMPNPLPSVGSAQRLRFASTLHKSTVYNRAKDLHRSKANHHSPGDKMIPNVHTSSEKNTKYIHTCVHHARVFSRKTERQMAVSHVIRLGVVFRGIPPPTAAIHVQKSPTHIHFGSMRSTSQAVS